MKIYDARAGGGFLCPRRAFPAPPPTSATAPAANRRRRLVVNTVGDKTGKGANFNPARSRGVRQGQGPQEAASA